MGRISLSAEKSKPAIVRVKAALLNRSDPPGAAGRRVGDLDAVVGEGLANGVAARKIFGLARLVALSERRLDVRRRLSEQAEAALLGAVAVGVGRGLEEAD